MTRLFAVVGLIVLLPISVGLVVLFWNVAGPRYVVLGFSLYAAVRLWLWLRRAYGVKSVPTDPTADAGDRYSATSGGLL